MHVNISLARGGRNIFAPGPDGAYSPAMRSFIAGVLARAGEICAFTNPVPGSYARFGSFEAPRYVAWSHQNRSQLIRIPAAPAPEYARIEVRMPDVSCNPYLAFALLLAAGFEGMERKMELAEETPYDLYTANAGALEALPASLEEAIARAGGSAFVEKVLSADTARKYLALKQAEQNRWFAARDKEKYQDEAYFGAL